MNYYIFIEDNKINGAGQARVLNEDTLNFEVTEELYNAYIAEPQKYIWDGSDVILDPDFDTKQNKAKQEVFNQEFFKTSLGYIRRQVNMATGDKKDFLSDLLPTISMAVQSGQTVPVITYKEPDFTQELTLEYMESLQEVKNVTPAFIQECFVQVSTDFLAVPLVVDEKV